MRRGGIRLAVVVSVAALAALSACGGGSDDSAGVASADGGAGAPASASASASADAAAQGLKFAQCMRDNGVPDFPDPDPDGGFSGAMADRLAEPAVEQALRACRSELPGARRDALQNPETQEKLRQMARCMRDEGYDVPDPDPNNPGGMLGASGLDRTDPKVRQALETCQQKVGFAPGGGR
jgi:hypothetical protein